MNKKAFCKYGHDMAVTRRITNGGNSYCSECSKRKSRERRRNNLERERKRCREWNKANPDKMKASHLHRKYNLGISQYEDMLKSQNDSCAICGTKEWQSSGPCVDHCHDSDLVRGILCSNCNFMLGYAKDDPIRLKTAINYLQKHYTPGGINV